MNGVIAATLRPLLNKQGAWVGRYRIQVGGVDLESRYPENRMAKALALAGVTGKMRVYGPSLDGIRTILRNTVDIERHARHQWSESDGALRKAPWTEHSLAALTNAAALLKQSFKEGKAGPAPASVPGGATCRSESVPAGGTP